MSFHNVKLESSSTITTGLPRAFPPGVLATPRGFALWALLQRASFRLGLARTLSPEGPTPYRALRRPAAEGQARHGITIGPLGPLGSPVPGCLARSHPQLLEAAGLAGITAPPPTRGGGGPTLDPIRAVRLGSSFPADSAKPVPLAVVSLDSR